MEQRDKTEIIFDLLIKGSDYLDNYFNLPKACEYFERARELAEEIYGKNSKICSIINLFDYIHEKSSDDYRAAVLKLADAGELLERFEKQDVTDEFTKWIYTEKESLLENVAMQTFQLFEALGADFSLDNLFHNLLLSKNDEESLINRAFADPLGLPHRFHYMIGRLNNNVSADPQMLYDLAQIQSDFKKINEMDAANASIEEVKNCVQKLISFADKNSRLYEKYGMAGEMSRFLDNAKKDISYNFARGMAILGETDYLDTFLRNIKVDDIDNIDEEIKIMLAKCWLNYNKGEKAEAEKILDDIMGILVHIIGQVLFLKNEKQKLRFLGDLSYITRRFADMCYKIRGAEAAYTAVSQTRNLSYDRSLIQLDTSAHRKKAFRWLELEQMEKEGADVSAEKESLMEYLQKASGELMVNITKVYQKLTDSQAILEFTVMTDISDTSYYYVFVVTSKDIQAVQLGECEELDVLLDNIVQYITDYSASRYSSMQIKELPAYYQLYQQAVSVIGEVIPRKIHSLYLAAAGNFIQIPFGMLPAFHWYDAFMEDEYSIIYINSGKEILQPVKTKNNSSALVIGNPDFEGTYPVLPFSEREVKAVADILNVSPITGKEAVADCLKNPAGIIHISTHSYEENEDLGQSGLVFAGGEKLSVQKISQMDLSETNLVVLSVCGVKEAKGVYSEIGPGIRRAFINANARHILINLWKTDDQAAELLMRYFYRQYIQKGMKPEESLRRARHFLRTSTAGELRNSLYFDKTADSVLASMKEDEIPYAHPYYWAGFIMIGI